MRVGGPSAASVQRKGFKLCVHKLSPRPKPHVISPTRLVISRTTSHDLPRSPSFTLKSISHRPTISLHLSHLCCSLPRHEHCFNSPHVDAAAGT